MTPEPPKRNGNMQTNLNTWLLAICMGLSSWVLYSINQLDAEIAGMIPLVNANSSAIQSVNAVDKEQSVSIEDIKNRLTKLETEQADHTNKN
jgi:hypothetical protein